MYPLDLCQLGSEHQLQPVQLDPGRGQNLWQPFTGRIPRRFHSPHPGTFPGHFRDGFRP